MGRPGEISKEVRQQIRSELAAGASISATVNKHKITRPTVRRIRDEESRHMSQERAQNIAAIEAWIAERDANGDFGEHEREEGDRKVLASELDCARSVFAQNPTVKALLRDAETRWYGKTPEDSAFSEASRDRAEKRSADASSQVSKLTDEVARLKVLRKLHPAPRA